MSAREALLAAVATMRCHDDRLGGLSGCELMENPGFDEHLVGGDTEGTQEIRRINHRSTASALLDGFSIEEVTEAGG